MQTAGHRIRTWLAEQLQRSTHLHDYLMGAGSAMELFPGDDDGPPVLCGNNRDALIADVRAVGRDMGIGYLRAEENARHTMMDKQQGAVSQPDTAAPNEHLAERRGPSPRQAAASAGARS
jgi:hypothetical protein